LPPSSEEAASLRKEIIQNVPSYKNLAQAAPIYKAMVSTAGTNSKASDLNLVYGLGKIMDPTSVVRDGELIMAKDTAGWSDKLAGWVNGLNGGQALTPETRKAIMAEAHGRISAYKDVYDQDMSHYSKIATKQRLDPEDVIHDFGKFDEWKGGPPSATVTPLPAQTAPQPAAAPSAQPANPGAMPTVTPTAPAIDMLRQNPALAPQFDEKYGPGASQKFLGGR
jgi:hypothetical protein